MSFTHRELGMELNLIALLNNDTYYLEVLNENGELIWEATKVVDDFIHPKFEIKSFADICNGWNKWLENKCL